MKTLIALAASFSLSSVPSFASNGTPISMLPFEATTPGYYYVTKNLVGDPDEHGIAVKAHNVVIDLCGFVLEGGAGTKAGIRAVGQWDRTRVLNGTVRDWGEEGIQLFSGAVVRDVNILDSGERGISVGSFALIERCHFRRNLDGDILAQAHSIVRDCRILASTEGSGNVIDLVSVGIGRGSVATRVVVSSGVMAFSGGVQAIFENCTAEGFRKQGFRVGTGGAAVNCMATPADCVNNIVIDCPEEPVVGIEVRDFGRVENCTVGPLLEPGILAGDYASISCSIVYGGDFGAAQNGIECGSYTRVTDCQVYENGQAGIFTMGGGNSITRNIAAMNQTGLWIQGAKNLVIENRAIENSLKDFTILYPNTFGPTLNTKWALQGSSPHANFRTPFP